LYLLWLFFFSCNNKKEKNTLHLEDESKKEIDESVIPFINIKMHNLIFRFSIPSDPYDLRLYQKFEILKSDKLLFSTYSDELEMESKKFDNNDRTVFKEKKRTIYLIECNNRPEPTFFRIIEFKNDSFRIIGDTEQNTAETIADIDNDGKLEICGYNFHCQGERLEDYNNPDGALQFEIQEIDNFFPQTNPVEYISMILFSAGLLWVISRADIRELFNVNIKVLLFTIGITALITFLII